MRHLFLFILFFAVINSNFAQQIPAIYIHTDRDFYFPGDTVWFKGYVTNNGLLSDNTLNLYLKFAEESGRVYQQSVALVSSGITASHFVVPLSYQGQELYLNAYTQLMNCPTQGCYFKKIGILQNEEMSDSTPTSTTPSVDKKYNINVYPESGILLSDMENQLIIQCYDELGYPAMAKGKLVEWEGQTLIPFETDSAGYAQILFIPVKGKKYSIDWVSDDDHKHKNSIPEIREGTKASIRANVDTTIIQLMSNMIEQQVTVIAKLGKRELFQQEFHLKKEKKITIPLQNKDLEYGILQVVVKDQGGQILSTRSHLLGQKIMVLEPIVTLERGSGEKSGNRLKIQLPNYEQSANLSVSVAAIDVPIDSATNIFTDLYLQPMTERNMIMPLTLWEKSINKDLFIQSQKWTDMICPSDGKIVKDSLFILKGQIIMNKNRWPGFYKDYKEIVRKDTKMSGASFGYQDFTASKMNYLKVDFDSEGRFNIPNLIVLDSMDTKFVQINRKLKYEPFHIKYEFFNPVIFDRPFQIPTGYQSFISSNLWKNKENIIKPNYTINPSGKRVLQTVTITRSRKQREIDRLERRFYTVGIPSNMKPDQILVPLLDSTVLKRSQILEDYLFNNIRSRKFEVYLNGRYIPQLSTDSISNIKADKYYDENISFLKEDISNFPYIKFYSTFSLAKGRPTVLIYQYSPNEVDKEIGKAVDEQTVMGYMPIKQYKAVVYENVAKKFSSGYDERLTLYWNPFVTISQKQQTAQATFFNNSKANGFCLTIQGVSDNGQLIYYRKIFK